MADDLVRSDLLSPIASSNNGCVIIKEGEVYLWIGRNDWDDDDDVFGTSTSSSCVKLDLADSIKQISCGFEHHLAVSYDGEVYAWGKNATGQLGIGHYNYRHKPTKIDNFNNINFIASGSTHNIAVTIDGDMFCWGSNHHGELGTGSGREPCEMFPTLVPVKYRIAHAACGNSFSVCISESQQVYAWGRNTFGQLASGDFNNRVEPTLINGLEGVVFIACGHGHVLCVDSYGKVHSWGNNGNGQLGIDDTVNRTSPCVISRRLPGSVSSVAAGGNHSMALTESGEIFCWGYNYYGQLGLSSFQDGWEPQRLTIVKKTFYYIACGGNRSYAVDISGTIYSWGLMEQLRYSNQMKMCDLTLPVNNRLVKSARNI